MGLVLVEHHLLFYRRTAVRLVSLGGGLHLDHLFDGRFLHLHLEARGRVLDGGLFDASSRIWVGVAPLCVIQAVKE
jgi:hypothetical protein